jgi:hypothetical protein
VRLRIGAHVWRVRRDKAALNAASHELGARLEGFCDSQEHLMVIGRIGSKSNQRETFMHEFLHAVNAACGLDVVLNGNEEEVVNRQAKVLLPALRDNPDAVEWLLEGVPRKRSK